MENKFDIDSKFLDTYGAIILSLYDYYNKKYPQNKFSYEDMAAYFYGYFFMSVKQHSGEDHYKKQFIENVAKMFTDYIHSIIRSDSNA